MLRKIALAVAALLALSAITHSPAASPFMWAVEGYLVFRAAPAVRADWDALRARRRPRRAADRGGF